MGSRLISQKAMEHLNRRSSQRISAIVDMLEEGLPTYDLCCDHGLIGLNAYAKKKAPQVVFCDALPHVMEALQHQVRRHDQNPNLRFLTARAETLQLNGERCNLVIAGVGGHLIVRMLKMLYAGGAKPHRLVLGPNRHAEVVEEYLTSHPQWQLQVKKHLVERGWDFTLYVVEGIESKAGSLIEVNIDALHKGHET